MGLTEIILLVIGGLFFVISFFLPDGTKKEKTEISKEEIKALIDEQLKNAKGEIEDMVEETINYSIEKTERALEKLTNEKIMAVDEYSQTVLKKINDNHQEAVFLYDMLNDKDEKLKKEVADTAKQPDKQSDRQETATEGNTVQKTISEAVSEAPKVLDIASDDTKEPAPAFVPFVPSHYAIKDGEAVLTSEGSHPIEPVLETEPEAAKEEPAQKPVKKPKTTSKKKPAAPKERPLGGLEALDDIPVRDGYDGNKNSNDLILRLHNEGKTNMQIARELGLGVGEVKLVIDLFDSKKGK